MMDHVYGLLKIILVLVINIMIVHQLNGILIINVNKYHHYAQQMAKIVLLLENVLKIKFLVVILELMENAFLLLILTIYNLVNYINNALKLNLKLMKNVK